MPEFLNLLPPQDARELLFSHLPVAQPASELLEVSIALGRILAEDITAPHPLPEFPRSTVDGYAVMARDSYGASESLSAYLEIVGEVPMGASPDRKVGPGQCMLIHTGGMLPDGTDAVVMLEYSQSTSDREIEIHRAVAIGENIISIGEDVQVGVQVLARGSRLRPAEIGGLLALGIPVVRVAKNVRVGLISSGDEVIPPLESPAPGQVRDINSYTLASLVTIAGGEPVHYGIVPDNSESLRAIAEEALMECDVVVVTAGSSASARDMTAEVIATLGNPGVLVHGVNTRPGKPTILAVCSGKAVIGLPGNPVSALVNGYLFVVPVIERLLGANPRPRSTILAKLTVNLASQAGREDWWPVKLVRLQPLDPNAQSNYAAEPIFGKSNLIFNLAAADGLLRIPADATGMSQGEFVEVTLLQ
jgi:molybdopterin molybdotransferase